MWIAIFINVQLHFSFERAEKMLKISTLTYHIELQEFFPYTASCCGSYVDGKLGSIIILRQLDFYWLKLT